MELFGKAEVSQKVIHGESGHPGDLNENLITDIIRTKFPTTNCCSKKASPRALPKTNIQVVDLMPPTTSAQ